MLQYIESLRKILEKGKVKYPVRKSPSGEFISVDGGVKTIGLPNVIFSHNMSDGFPLLTCRKLPWLSIRVELEGFIRGITSKQWYIDRKCHYWDQWCSPSRLPGNLTWDEKKAFMLKEDDLGPIYGYQWRNFNGELPVGESNHDGYDQLGSIVHTLQTNYNDRRMVCSAWNPNQMKDMALPPCHLGFVLCVYGDELNLCWKQRSCDMLLGVPSNIASYALLLHLLSEVSGLKPGNLTGVLVDCHIYENQIEVSNELLQRELRPLPTIETAYSGDFDIFEWEAIDTSITNYNPHPAIPKIEVVV